MLFKCGYSDGIGGISEPDGIGGGAENNTDNSSTSLAFAQALIPLRQTSDSFRSVPFVTILLNVDMSYGPVASPFIATWYVMTGTGGGVFCC